MSPSTVASSAPSAWTASMMHERAASPLYMIVHAPQIPCSHPTWVPVSPRSSRMKSTRSLRGSHRPSWATPFTFNRTVTMSATRDSDRPHEGALGEHSSEVAPIVRRGVNVGVGLDELRRLPRRGVDRSLAQPLALENLFGSAEPHRHRAGPSGGQPGRLAALSLPHHHRRDADDC